MHACIMATQQLHAANENLNLKTTKVLRLIRPSWHPNRPSQSALEVVQFWLTSFTRIKYNRSRLANPENAPQVKIQYAKFWQEQNFQWKHVPATADRMYMLEYDKLEPFPRWGQECVNFHALFSIIHRVIKGRTTFFNILKANSSPRFPETLYVVDQQGVWGDKSGYSSKVTW